MAIVDPYFDDTIDDLRNLLGANSSEELKKLEPQVVFANELELDSIGIPRTNDLTELLLIHRQLFKGVYDWAGKIRTVDIKKNAEGAKYFLVVSKINDAANYVFGELTKEKHLRGLSKEEFINRLAYFYDQLITSTHFAKAMVGRNEYCGIGLLKTQVMSLIGRL